MTAKYHLNSQNPFCLDNPLCGFLTSNGILPSDFDLILGFNPGFQDTTLEMLSPDREMEVSAGIGGLKFSETFFLTEAALFLKMSGLGLNMDMLDPGVSTDVTISKGIRASFKFGKGLIHDNPMHFRVALWIQSTLLFVFWIC